MVKTLSANGNWEKRLQELAAGARNPVLKRFYERSVIAGATPLQDLPMVAMDFETTGLNAKEDGIVSIGLVPFRLSRILCSGSQHWVVYPKCPLDSSVVIHRITHSEIENAPDITEVLEEILQALAGRLVVVHYRGIERNFFDRALRTRLGEGIQFPVLDTMAIEAHMTRGKGLRWWQRLLGTSPVSLRLADTRTRYGLPTYQPHHALTDALATAELLQAQIAYHYSPETPVEKLWL